MKVSSQFTRGYKCGKLTVQRECLLSARPLNDKSHIYYDCLCDCGNTTLVKKGDLTRHHKLSCGCHRKSVSSRNLSRWYKNGNVNPNRDFVGDISGAFWCRLKFNAKERGIKVKITRRQAWSLFLKQNRRCALSNIGLALSPLTSHEHENTASLDRIDSNMDYTLKNVQWIHKDVNLMKLDFQNEYFIDVCKRIAATHK